MFFILSKIIYWLVMPTSLIAWLVIASLLVKRHRQKHILRILAISLFFFFTNPWISTVVMNAWEPDPLPFHNFDQEYSVGIVLSGITNPNRPPFDRVQFNKGADRIVHAIELYKLSIIHKILITGGSGTLTFEGNKECYALQEFAISSGVPIEDILIENRARNTRENALFTKELIAGIPGQTMLITSAFHMRRAQGCFQKVGLETIPFPTDHYGEPIHYTPDDIIIPSIIGLKIWTILTKEWIGIVAYWAAGYI
ncbi:MAG: YdcF family protein [Reichenbachiella sp.]|uniref:YdcF family protein n=1 Tax=Reichenbachiella sp. TaxID=2184521 RepID=UPI00329951B5